MCCISLELVHKLVIHFIEQVSFIYFINMISFFLLSFIHKSYQVSAHWKFNILKVFKRNLANMSK